MKTDSLIEALAADGIVERGGLARAGAVLLPASILLLCAVFAAALGVRPNIGTPQVAAAVMLKLAITVTMAAAGLFLAYRQAGANPYGRTTAYLLAAPLFILALALMLDIDLRGLSGWQARLIGSNGWRCVMIVPLLSVLPLAAILLALRRGAVTRHILTGTIGGIAAAGIGASFYALNCTDDSPFFIAAWYGLATAIVAGLGAVSCRLFVRW